MFRPFHFFIVPGVVLFLLSLYPLAWTVIHTVEEFGKLAGQGLSIDYRLSEAIAGAFPISAGVIFQCEPPAYADAPLKAAFSIQKSLL